MKKKMEFSKKVFFGISLAVTLLVVFVCFMVFRTNDLEPFRYLIPSSFTVLGTAVGFYYNKAKAENQIKISQYSNYNYEEEGEPRI